MIAPLAVRVLLWPVSLVYGVIVRLRAGMYARGWFKQRRLRGAVISVGNLTVGGTGKTPMVLWLAEKFIADGKRVAILSRGYRGASGTSDEVDLLRSRLQGRAVFGVGKDRYTEGQRIESQQPIDIFLLDDGFQHLALQRDMDLVMLDGSRKLKNEWLLPAGYLREPISACRRANVLVVTRSVERPDIAANDSHSFSIFYAQTRLLGFRCLGNGSDIRYFSELGGGSFFAFCGIGNPDAFFGDLHRWHVPLVGRMIFRDHHRYTQKDILGLEARAAAAGAAAFVTTEKDAQNLSGAQWGKLPVFVSIIDLVLNAESEFVAAIDRLLAKRSGAAA